MKYERRQKAESIAKKLIWEFLQEIPEDVREAFTLITVTDVELAPDLSYLDVSVSSLKNISELPKALAVYADDIERLLAKKMDLLHIPRVRFRSDTSGETLFHVSQTLWEISPDR